MNFNDEFEKERIKFEEMANNTATRLPLCLCIDASMSMRFENRIDRINGGIRQLIADLKAEPYAVDSVELSIISFGGKKHEVICDFSSVAKISFEDIRVGGATPLGGAVRYALDRLEERVQFYNDEGLDYYKPWLIIMSDGEATDDYRKVAQDVKFMEANEDLKVKCVVLGNEGFDTLKSFTKEKVIGIDEIKISSFFSWLSSSMGDLMKSTPGIKGGTYDDWIG